MTSPDNANQSAPNRLPANIPTGIGFALLASAFVLVALVVVQVGRFGVPAERPAYADLVSGLGDYTVMTVANSNSEDLVVVLDGRSEEILAYQVGPQGGTNRLVPVARENLQALFNGARNRFAGR